MRSSVPPAARCLCNSGLHRPLTAYWTHDPLLLVSGRVAACTAESGGICIKAAPLRCTAGRLPHRAAAALRSEQLHQPQPVTGAYAATGRSPTVIIAALNGEISSMEQQVMACFRRHPHAAIYLSQPGIGEILGARELGEFGDDPHRYASASAQDAPPGRRATDRPGLPLGRKCG
jgi:transposase